MLELDHILSDEAVTPEQLTEFFRDYDFDSEEWLVAVIKARLRTPEQKKQLDERDLNIYDILNGRYEGKDEKFVEKIFSEWNAKLGFKRFGS